MEKQIVEAFNEMKAGDHDYSSLGEIRQQFSSEEVLDAWLRYEGIIGYTTSILTAIDEINNICILKINTFKEEELLTQQCHNEPCCDIKYCPLTHFTDKMIEQELTIRGITL